MYSSTYTCEAIPCVNLHKPDEFRPQMPQLVQSSIWIVYNTFENYVSIFSYTQNEEFQCWLLYNSVCVSPRMYAVAMCKIKNLNKPAILHTTIQRRRRRRYYIHGVS